MPAKRPYCLTIAAHDPSGGAGLNADLKVFEMHKVYGLSVCSGLTVQTESTFEQVQWTDLALIKAQIRSVMEAYKPSVVKVGLIENIQVLQQSAELIKEYVSDAKIIWDPILATSTGFEFEHNPEQIREQVNSLFMITPNWTEFQHLFGSEYSDKFSNEHGCYIYLKGGHNESAPGKDILIPPKGSKRITQTFNPKVKNPQPKHGSGCTLSASLAANFAKGFPVKKACLNSKRYMEHVLMSNPSLLGWHR